MTNRLNNLKNAAQHIRLSHEEKASMRAYIYEVMAASQKYAAPKRSPYFFFAYSKVAMSFAVLVLIIGVGGTTTYAAKGSLPGSALYPIKIYVNENIGEALAVSEEAKVSFHTNVAEERLKEAEALASEGKLDAVAVAEIEANFSQHVEKADTIAANLEEKDAASGVGARVALDSSIAAHSSILVNIGDNSKDENTRENSNSIAMKAQSHSRGGIVAMALKATAPVATSVETMAFSAGEASDTEASTSDEASITPPQARMLAKGSATATIPAATTSSQKKIALDLEKKAVSQFNDVEGSYDNSHASLSASTTAKVKLQLSSLEKNLNNGKNQMKAGNYEAARTTYTEVIKTSIELRAFIDASRLYKRDFIGSLWGEVRGWSGSSNGHQDTDGEKHADEETGMGGDAPNSSTTTLEGHAAPSSTSEKEVEEGVHSTSSLNLKGVLKNLGL
jgi:hypothetical protein